MVLLERLYRRLPGKPNASTAEQWKYKQHVKAPLREDKWYGMGTRATKNHL
jgi:hypothetical protein